jgi:hypothetical protein
MLNELKLLANKMDIPYQSLIKVYVRERIDQDLRMVGEKQTTPGQ